MYVPAGAPSAKVLVTNLYNHVQPLIRYELTDTFIRQPKAAEHGYLRARVQGRNDDVLHYGAVLAKGSPAEIQNNPRVLEVYLKT